MSVTITEGMYLGDLLKWEASDRYSREKVTIKAGSGAARALVLGEVIGRENLADAVTTTPDAGNTGDGAVGAVTLGSKAVVGTYKLECITAATNGGIFKVVSPGGNRLKDLTVTLAYAGDHLNLTIADGAADFIVGDKIDIIVAKGTGQVTALDLTADDGRQAAYGAMIYPATAPDGSTTKGVAVVRQAKLAPSALVWPSGITADQKTAALEQLAERGIITVEEV